MPAAILIIDISDMLLQIAGKHPVNPFFGTNPNLNIIHDSGNSRI